jgi:ribulose-5-phosphate 4-epimerase/fuculose-1-phosphate aldolase
MLKELAALSQAAGARADYIQGSGGNTSVKFGDGLMAVKASGTRLAEVTETDGFAIVETATLRNITREKGFKPANASVEAGFHALLRRTVLHTHAVYVNLAMCSESGAEKLPELAAGVSYITVPYRNPGAELCAAIAERLRPDTQVIFLQNHGIIVTADTAAECLSIHDELNQRIGSAYGVKPSDFNAFTGEMGKTLYPDHQISLTLSDMQREVLNAVMFIHFTLMKNNETVRSMQGDAKDYKSWGDYHGLH